MHEVLLIHYDNTPLLEKFSNSIKFNPSTDELKSSDIDTFISKKIIPQIQNKRFSIICIKDTLSENYIDFYGLILAHHIRLSTELLNEKSLAPIIILSDINELMINKLSSFGRLLFTKNIFLCQNNIAAVKKIEALSLKPLSEEEYESQFIKLINIDPPQDYLSHHSITNEWAIDQWAKMLNVDSQVISKNREKISSLLYYKFLTSKYHPQNKNSLKIKQKEVCGHLLLIDDKWKEGWQEIIQKFLASHFTGLHFDTLTEIDKFTQMEELKSYVRDKINSMDAPDLVLLDLRMLDCENTSLVSQQINRLSGVVILKMIKEINPSIQVIMFTASSDSMILDEIRDKGILGYVKKDTPTERYQASLTSFKKLSKLIKLGLSKKYLKKIHFVQQEILALKNIHKCPEIINNVSLVFNILNSNLPQPFIYAMYAIFTCLETVNDQFMRESKRGGNRVAIWLDNDQQVSIRHVTIENKIKIILQEKLNLRDENIDNEIRKLVCCRNNAIHPGKLSSNCKRNFIAEPSHQHIEEWFTMLKVILQRLDSFYMA